MLVNIRDILSNADKNKYAQGAFNVNAVSQIEAAINIHELFRSPAILQGANLANGFMGGRVDFQNSTIEDKRMGAKNIAYAVKKFEKNSSIPIALHLDHGNDYESCVVAIDCGYTSVMIDGSSLPFDENVELTREVVKFAHKRGVSVEGELGILAGVEDDITSEKSTYTNPMKAIDFFKRTGADALAISYGTKHGPNKGKDAVIRKEIPIAIRECMLHEGINGFLVSHGSSTIPKYIVDDINKFGGKLSNMYGISIDQLVEVSKYGINKINVDTDIRLAVTRNIRELLNSKPQLKKEETIKTISDLLEKDFSIIDPRAYLYPMMNTLMYGEIPNSYVNEIILAIERGVKEIIGELIVNFGSYGRASEIKCHTLDEMAEWYRMMEK